MSRAILPLGALCLLAAPAVADDVFSAPRVGKLEDVVWALTATCADHGDDTQQRQCKQIRDARARSLAGQTLLVEGDATAFSVGAYDTAKKSAPISLVSCIDCSSITVEGKSWQVFGGTPRLLDGKIVAPALHDSAQTFATPDEHAAYRKKTAAARVDFVVRIPAKRTWTVGGKTGLQLEVVGYRVVVPCTGEVVLAKPASPALEPDKKACAK